jgi:hypothetical protein
LRLDNVSDLEENAGSIRRTTAMSTDPSKMTEGGDPGGRGGDAGGARGGEGGGSGGTHGGHGKHGEHERKPAEDDGRGGDPGGRI